MGGLNHLRKEIRVQVPTQAQVKKANALGIRMSDRSMGFSGAYRCMSDKYLYLIDRDGTVTLEVRR